MIQLQPFKPAGEISLSGDVLLEKSLVKIFFQIDSGLSEIDINGQPSEITVFHGRDIQRRDQLWEKTCFEVFIRPPNSHGYFELNFGFLREGGPAWACYEFTDYRLPRPPVPSFGFELNRFTWDPKGALVVELINQTRHKEFHIGLTAVVVLKDGSKAYFALTHSGESPDFHLSQSFILQRK